MDLERQRVRDAGQQRHHRRDIRAMKLRREAQRAQAERPAEKEPVVVVLAEEEADRRVPEPPSPQETAASLRAKLLRLEQRRGTPLAPLCGCG